jgi:hypothetical protein
VSVHLAKQFQRRFLEIDQTETRIACGGHVCQQIRTKCANIIEDYWLISIKASLKPLCQMTRNLVGSIYVRSSIQIANFVPIHLQTWSTDRDEISNLYRGPSIDISCKLSVHLAKHFQRRRFLKFQPMRTHYGPWQPCWISNQHQKHKST